MSKMIKINAELIGAELFALADILKTAIVVSAAALLSRTNEDVKENAALAVGHLEEMGTKLDGVRNSVSQKKGVTLAARLKGSIKEIDIDAIIEIVNVIDFRVDSYRKILFDVLESKHREGIDLFAGAVGPLGRAVQQAIALVWGRSPGSPIFFDLFFAETMKNLSKESWGEEGS